MNQHSLKKAVNTDIIVIGGGGAGLTAALAAAENGVKSIMVLEKRNSLGGNTAFATGLFACESPVQTRERIVADKDTLFKKMVQWARWSRVNPRILRAFINKSGDTIRWLENKGLEFAIYPFVPNQQPRVWHCPKGRGARLTQVLAEKCQDLGVILSLKTSGKKIIRDRTGLIKGVTAIKEGQTFDIMSSCVVITTGGFGGNKKLLHQYCSSYYADMPLRGLPLEGDGLYLAMDIGAKIDDSATLLKEGPRVSLNTWPLMGIERSPETLWVNKKGRRFIDEAVGEYPFESVNAILEQPDKVCFTILDSDMRKKFEEIKPGLESALHKQANKDHVKISDSWDQIAQWINADHETLKHTINDYNVFCDQGYDADFAKDRRYLLPLRTPPYYAIRCMPVFLDTMGGIQINEHMAVKDNHDQPIPGLYAAGVITSGWVAENYCSELSGSAFGFTINSGRIAGENAAAFILSMSKATG